QIDLLVIVNYRNTVLMSSVDKICNIADVLISLESITDNIGIIGYLAFALQALHNLNIKSSRSLNMNIILQRLIKYVFKMRAFRTVTIVIIAFVIVLHKGIVEPLLGTIDIFRNFRQVSEFKWSSVFFYQFH